MVWISSCINFLYQISDPVCSCLFLYAWNSEMRHEFLSSPSACRTSRASKNQDSCRCASKLFITLVLLCVGSLRFDNFFTNFFYVFCVKFFGKFFSKNFFKDFFSTKFLDNFFLFSKNFLKNFDFQNLFFTYNLYKL